jgi:phosphatidylserine decarboxylase
MSLVRSLRLVLAPPHPAGKPFVAAGAVACLAGLIWSRRLAWAGGLFGAACLGFFRDPERVTPGRAGLVVAPADGKIVAITQVAPPAELGCGSKPVCRISIFLSVLDVHVNRIPADGTVTQVAYHRGGFLDASSDQASATNERNGVAIRLPDGRCVAVVQIAGLIARRIVCTAHPGDRVRAGERFGIIRFGSRTDLYLPPGVDPLVSMGQTMVGGETVIAELLVGHGAESPDLG